MRLGNGGYGFIGSHVAEVFFRKGHQVTIIDNLLDGQPDKRQVQAYVLSD